MILCPQTLTSSAGTSTTTAVRLPWLNINAATTPYAAVSSVYDAPFYAQRDNMGGWLPDNLQVSFLSS